MSKTVIWILLALLVVVLFWDKLFGATGVVPKLLNSTYPGNAKAPRPVPSVSSPYPPKTTYTDAVVHGIDGLGNILTAYFSTPTGGGGGGYPTGSEGSAEGQGTFDETWANDLPW